MMIAITLHMRPLQNIRNLNPPLLLGLEYPVQNYNVIITLSKYDHCSEPVSYIAEG